jgi:hypothetical protein
LDEKILTGRPKETPFLGSPFFVRVDAIPLSPSSNIRHHQQDCRIRFWFGLMGEPPRPRTENRTWHRFIRLRPSGCGTDHPDKSAFLKRINLYPKKEEKPKKTLQ